MVTGTPRLFRLAVLGRGCFRPLTESSPGSEKASPGQTLVWGPGAGLGSQEQRPCLPRSQVALSLFWAQFLIRLIHKELSCPGSATGDQAP